MTSEIAHSVLDDFYEQWPDVRSDLDPSTALLIDCSSRGVGLRESEAHLLVEPHDEGSWTVGVPHPG